MRYIYDMEITPSLFYFLLVLTKPLHGYQIMQEVEEASDGILTMGAGTCYGLISKCLEDKLIRLKEEKLRKKIYEITPKGQQILQGEMERLSKQLGLAKQYLGVHE